MGFTSFVGRVFFSAIFVFSAWQKINEFAHDGGSTLQSMEPKINALRNHGASFGISIPDFELKHMLMATIALEGLGGVLFILGTNLGAYLLLLFLVVTTPVMHDFYNYMPASTQYGAEFAEFVKNLSFCGALLFYIGERNDAAKKMKKTVKTKTL